MIKFFKPMKPDMDSLANVINDETYISGKSVQKFEEAVERYLGKDRRAVALNSCTDALFISLKCLGIGEGDEIITTPFTFWASTEAILRTGAKPVFVDIDMDYNIRPADILTKINSRTKTVLIVHMFGRPCKMDKIKTICRNNGLYLVEDCAQAFGAEFRGRKVGTFGHFGCFSFFPTKILGGYGDGGMIVTTEERCEQIKSLRNHGFSYKHHPERVGFNSRLDTIQAAWLLQKMELVNDFIENRNIIARLYSQHLPDDMVRAKSISGTKQTYNVYTIQVPKRDSLKGFLSACDIETQVYYPQLTYQNCLGLRGGCPDAESIIKDVLSLPIYPEMLHKDVIEVCEQINNWLVAKSKGG